jgi:nickel-dependent lactate racemase
MIPPFCIGRGAPATAIAASEQEALLQELLRRAGRPLRRVLLLPPDFTRFNSGAGALCRILHRLLSPTAQVDIMPALGTHAPMTEAELRTMFGPEIPLASFKVHDWRHEIRHLGDVPGELLRDWSEGRVDYSVRVEVNKILFAGYDLILSLGQIVPHEVVGMANYTKNLMVGVGGADIINKSHFLGASYGMERIMGRADTPVRRLFDHAAATFLGELPILFVQTVMQKDKGSGGMAMRGLFLGAGAEPFQRGARLSQQVNLDLLARPLRKVVVYLDPAEFKSTWLGNKAIYRTRMAMADQGELVILAPALKEFGEDPEINRLIQKYGYHGTPATLAAVRDHAELRHNLSAAAHLIHGSSEGRFTITYCPGPHISRAAVEAVGFQTADLDAMLRRYDPAKLQDGPNTLPDGEEIFFISNPALGLWALKKDFA